MGMTFEEVKAITVAAIR